MNEYGSLFRWSVVLVFLGLSVSPVGAVVPDTWTTGPTRTGTIIQVHDGDTFKMRLPDGDTRMIRLIGVDTPETYRKNTPESFGMKDSRSVHQCLRRYGYRATDWIRQQLHPGDTVTVHFDRILDQTGYYGRTLGYVEYKGSFINEQLLEQGYARLYESDFMGNDRFRSIQSTAQSDSRNVWTCEEASP